MLEWRPILLVNGIFLSIIACFMLIPAAVDIYLDNPDWEAFLQGFAMTFFIGVSLFLTNRGYRKALTIRQAFMLTASSWIVIPIFAALPFRLSAMDMSMTDAYFEAVSAFTTTGATVLTGLDTAPPGLLLWRSLLQWLGGVGIIAMAVAILPLLRIGGMQLFRTESSDQSDKILPRARQIATAIGTIYVSFTACCALMLWLAGLSGFDAINHAMTTVATAGYSTHDASIGYFNNLNAELIIMLFMVLSALPYLLYFQVLRGRTPAFYKDEQVRIFLLIMCVAILMMTAWLQYSHTYPGFWAALRYASFNVISVATTTGYSTADYYMWGTFPVTALFLFCVLGGCTGSTSGGIKVFRLNVLLETAKVQIGHLIRPHQVLMPMYNGKPIEMTVTNAVMSYCLLFALCFMVLSMALSLFGLDYITSMSGAAAVLSNLGPGMGDIIGPAGNYQNIPDGAKYVLSFGMILGRLELFTILVLLSPNFWRH